MSHLSKIIASTNERFEKRDPAFIVPQHDGWIELSDVEGMVSKDGSGKTINDSGKIKIKTCTKKVCTPRFH